MDLRYLNYVNPETKYYERQKNKSDEGKLNEPIVPKGWEKTCDNHWMYVLNKENILPIQGWKIHLSTHLDDAQEMIDKVSKVLISFNVTFKYVYSLWELMIKNSKYGDRGSSGKFITVYPKDEAQFEFLLNELHETTKDLKKGTYILSDKRWKDGNVYFRYGAFAEMFCEIEGEKRLAIKNEEGKYVPDSRGPFYYIPDFISEPEFIQKEESDSDVLDSGFSKLDQYDIQEALHFSNGGGVYKAIQKSTGKTVVIKEGRPGAGLDGHSRDAVARIFHESTILQKIRGSKYSVQYIDSFYEWEHIFLVEEYIPGATLNTWTAAYYPFTNETRNNDYCVQVVGFINDIRAAIEELHSYGLGMGDLQPENIIVTEENKIRIIDFETADSLDDMKPSGLMTPGFVSPVANTREQADWYALLRIARFAFLPIGPVQDLADDIVEYHDQWILNNYGVPALNLIREISKECQKRIKEKPTTLFTSTNDKISLQNSAVFAQKMREGMIVDLTKNIQLLPGDIRQYETKSGMLNILTGGFGIIMSLMRSGKLPEVASQWIKEYSKEEYIEPIEEGLFTGKAGIASVLLEYGLKEKAFQIYKNLKISNETSDISILSGLSGIGLSLLAANKFYNDQELHKKITVISNQLEKLLDEKNKVQTWDIDFIPMGLLDGWTGAALFFTKLYENTKNEKHLLLAKRAIQKDLNKCVFGDDGQLQIKDNSRVVPYLAGGSAGIGITLIEMMRVAPDTFSWQQELSGIEVLINSKTFYSGGLFRGLGGIVEFSNVNHIFKNSKHSKQLLAKAVENLNLYLLSNEGYIYYPGDYSYKISGDIFSGSAGILLCLNDINEKQWGSWIPIYKPQSFFRVRRELK